jgi:hypothetical protein
MEKIGFSPWSSSNASQGATHEPLHKYSFLLVRPALTTGPAFLLKEIELWVRSCTLGI